jgi:hypothetical protein
VLAWRAGQALVGRARHLQERPGRGGGLQRREVLAGPRRFEGDAESLEPGERAAQRPDGLGRPARLGVGEALGPVAGGGSNAFRPASGVRDW